MDRFVECHSDLNDAVQIIKEMKFPYFISTYSGKPTDPDDLAKWRRLNSFFHRGIAREYSRCSGLLEDEAKSDLQKRFAMVSEQSDCYIVESVSGMSVPRMMEFIEQCQIFLIREFGVVANEMTESNKDRFIKTKKVSKTI